MDDVIVEFDGKDVKEWRDLPRIVAYTPAGKDVAVTIIRKGKELTKTVKVGRLEDADNARQEKPVAFDPKSEAAAKHLAPGMVIVEVQQQPVSSPLCFLYRPRLPGLGSDALIISARSVIEWWPANWRRCDPTQRSSALDRHHHSYRQFAKRTPSNLRRL